MALFVVIQIVGGRCFLGGVGVYVRERALIEMQQSKKANNKQYELLLFKRQSYNEPLGTIISQLLCEGD